jgi:Septum formation
MTEWGSWGAGQGAGGESPPPTQPWGSAPPPGGPYEQPPAYPPQQYPPGAYQQPPPYQQDPYQQEPYQSDYYGGYQSGGFDPPPRGSNRGPLIIMLVLVGVVLLGGAAFFVLGGDDDDDETGTGTETTLPPGVTTTTAAPQGSTTVPGGEADVFTLGVGQCWTDDTNAEELSSVTVIPCDQPHEYEVYDAFDLADGDYPGQDSVNQSAQTDCTTRFETFVGIPYSESQYYLSYLTPTEESWANGDREVLCSIYDQNGPTTGSLAGVGT